MRPSVTSRQEKLAEVLFEFNKVDEIIFIYEERHEQVNEQFWTVYTEVASLNNKFDTEER